MIWFPYAIIATVCLGISIGLYKLPSIKNHSVFFSAFYTNLWALLLVVILFSSHLKTTIGAISWYGFVWGIFFAANMILQKMILKKMETNAVFPVTSAISNVVTILIGFFVLSESVSLLQLLAIVIVLVCVFLFTRKKEDFPLTSETIVLCTGIILTSIISKYIQKAGAVHSEFSSMLFYQYFGAAAFAILIGLFIERKNVRGALLNRRLIQNSGIIGLFTFLGGYFIVKALAVGPLSGVYSIQPAYTFVAALLGAWFFKENLTKRKVFLILLALIGVILIKIG
jgi:drug/metabolite transporter (DMT)-like permease